ncbi:MAG: HD domain-containing protein [Bacillota bacterium]|nr:HD domain-containing protein [Bacillota bacterium]
MLKENYKNIYTKLLRKLGSIRWQDKWNIKSIYIDDFLSDNDIKLKLNEILENQDFSPKAVLTLCQSVMDKLSYPAKINDWLDYIYQYTLNKSFEEASSIVFIDSLAPSCEVYLRVLSIILDYEKEYGSKSFLSKYPLYFLSQEEEDSLENSDEYRKFVKAFKKNYTYEMMRLSQQVLNYNTLEHICGVHYLSMFLARQLKAKGIEVDLGRVSGAAAGHDIGKYGCKGAELKRVPYLHYYYTEQWFNRYGIKYIGNIALNHSTWDLELENLPLESLILIYSDFRVKNKENSGGMNIFSLEDSFNIILNKLDNVNAEKEKRYKRVFEKLKDFQSFLLSLGINTELDGKIPASFKKEVNFSLLQGDQIVDEFKYLSINHNISLMYQLRDEYSLGEILEEARSEKSWKNLREYIRVFEEYSTYLTQNQKRMTMSFLYDNLIHPEDDIRRHSAEILGTLISSFDEDYRKELPSRVAVNIKDTNSLSVLKEFMDLLIYPSHKIIPSQKSWILYSAPIMVSSLFRNAKESMISGYRKVILDYFNGAEGTERMICLLQIAKSIPLTSDNNEIRVLYDFIISMLSKRNISIRLAAMNVSYIIINKLPNDHFFCKYIKDFLLSAAWKDKTLSERYLNYKTGTILNIYGGSQLNEFIEGDDKELSDIFLSNLKSDTSWIVKKIQIDLLTYYSITFGSGSLLHTAIHFCNLLKVSDMEGVRNQAGDSIVSIMPYLSLPERNEVAVELLRALEIEGQRFTEYIPKYLGKVILFLQPKELDEIIDDLAMKIKSSTPNIKSLLIKSIGFAIEDYSNYRSLFKEKDENYSDRLNKLLSIVLNGLADFNYQVKQASFTIIGKYIFGNRNLTLETKQNFFQIIGKKLLTLITDNKNQELLFLNISAGLNHIYRFISDYSFFIGKIKIKIPEKVAFFPGTFDPFSLSHKEIVKKIKEDGFQVYLALDEFSWSKQTLPTLLRRNILNMSIADELDVYIYPDSMPTNLGNEQDLQRLRNNFKKSSLYIAVGSDVVLNASSYKKGITDKSIHNFNHIIFERSNKKIDKISSIIKGDIRYLKLSSKFSEISSSKIRTYIDESRDISSLVDPLAEQYVYENGFYQRQPQEKSVLTKLNLQIQIIDRADQDIINEIVSIFRTNRKKIKEALAEVFNKPSGRIMLLRNSDDKIIGFSCFYWVRSSELCNDLRDYNIASLIREKSVGRIILLESLYVSDNSKYKTLEQILITEVLAFAIGKDYEYAIFSPTLKEFYTIGILELLEKQGFTKLKSETSELPILCVNMCSPCVINLDIEQTLKEPFRSSPQIKDVIYTTRRKLQDALVKLYPGQLMLSMDIDMLHQQMIRKLCSENNVSTEESASKKLGAAMCVPYGDILDRYVIPNTVTKVLHTEKIYAEDIKSFKIGQFPHYLDLKTQIKMIESFNRPVILADTLIHKGYRLQALDPLLKEADIQVKKIIVGIMSGRGKDLMDVQKRDVDCVYFIPRLKFWINEDSLYPFIGGDAMFRGIYPERNLIPSINLILPYASPVYIRNVPANVIFNLSKICIENSIEILEALEEEFHIIHQRNLNLSSLGQVFKVPRCVDRGRNIEYDLSQSPSLYLKNDLENLLRMEDIVER